MTSWSGFTDDDLKKLQKSDGDSAAGQRQRGFNSGSGSPPQTGKKKITSTSKPRPQRAVQPMKKQPSTSLSTEPVEIADAARLSSPKPIEGITEPKQTLEEKSPEIEPAIAVEPNVMTTGPACPQSSHPPQPDFKPMELLTDDDGRSRELTNLGQYQQQQKMMEELNKKKKQMLAEALAQRQKQATVETHKLNAIKKELSHLDQVLTADVGVIRDRIEEATREYAEASKRYDLAEKEFIGAKINLHKKNEMKEQLTEHLYTIIHQNEVRKAKKLAELMDKLNLATEEADAANTTLPALPSYSVVGNMQTVGSGNLVKHSISTEKNLPSPTESNAKTIEDKSSSPGEEQSRLQESTTPSAQTESESIESTEKTATAKPGQEVEKSEIDGDADTSAL